ncbi:hypothetical protein K1T71_012750 [Dendrolimus kikuchii]|uniref:Uncharacterized protein n=1 Tax=Dendrolimus kikuchii TaxID=765133 RepID=A0ACC1CKH4_9NEOP|nr:hypothetical protein K1T71_012750 [Dendrolimus kikuchii]
MESVTGKIQIGLLEGKSNWDTWKYKVRCLLRTVPQALEVVEGSFLPPSSEAVEGGDGIGTFNTRLEQYIKANATALLILTTNMHEETLRKVMRFTKAREVWLELHRLFDGTDEDKAYNLCMSFFSYKKDQGDDIATHMSKLKNIWTQLNIELKKDNNRELPELLFICKILDTLEESFFPFKSSWLLQPKADPTIENLTSHLCAFERALKIKSDTSQEVLVVNKTVQKKKPKAKKCHYCSQKGHWVRDCPKWIGDGRPPKPSESGTNTSPQVQNITLIVVNACSSERLSDRDNWFVDNGATVHITNRGDFFQDFADFDLNHTVTTADGTTIPAKGKGSVVVESSINGRKEIMTLSNVWYVPSLKRNLFSALAAQDKIPNSMFTSTSTECKLIENGKPCLIGHRKCNGGLYKLDLKAIIPTNHIQVNVVTSQEDLLQIYHERFGHQNPRHVRSLVKRELGIDIPCDGLKCEGCIYGKAHRLKFGKRERATRVGELIHTDMCGPFEESFSKFKSFHKIHLATLLMGVFFRK